MSKNNNLRLLLKSLKQASHNDLPLFVFPKTGVKYIAQVVRQLHESGLIQGYEDRGHYYILRLKQTYWKGWGRPVKSLLAITGVPRVRKRDTLKHKSIKKIQFIEGSAYTLVVSTDRGVLSGAGATQLGVGGFPLVRAS